MMPEMIIALFILAVLVFAVGMCGLVLWLIHYLADE